MAQIVLIIPSGENISMSVAELGRNSRSTLADVVTVITWESHTEFPAGIDKVVLGAETTRQRHGRAQSTLRSVFSRSALGRNILRLTPLDGGRRMWRAVRKNPHASRSLHSADMIVAVDHDGIFTAWKSVHTSLAPQASAVFGLTAAKTALESATD